MSSAGFVLAGGQSRRMGTDKALLPHGSGTLLEFVARQVLAVAGTITVIGPPERYAGLGLEILPDSRVAAGPLGGIETALSLRRADRNLIVACDLPAIDCALLRRLFQEAERTSADCVMAESPAGVEPLLAVWRLTCLSAVRACLDAGIRKVTDALDGLVVRHVPVSVDLVINWNRPEDVAGGPVG